MEIDEGRGVERLEELYRREMEGDHDRYLVQHASENSIRRQVSVVARYARHVPDSGVLLDWGCRHAPDSVLIRDALGPAVELHGCDFTPADEFPVFHGASGLAYKQLHDAGPLPYEDATFDAVIGAGVIEHTANHGDALRELHRVMKERAVLIFTFVPNRLSYTEFIGRRLSLDHTHARLYGRRELTRLLLSHGFLPIETGNHQMVPAHRVPGPLKDLWKLNGRLERLPPLNRLSTNLMVVAQRRGAL